MNDSILTTIKKLLGLTEDQKEFDTDIIIYINSTFSKLYRLGVGTTHVFSIQDEYAIWGDFIEDDARINDVKNYIYLKVKLIFDPPLSSSVLSAIERQIKELEWDLNVTSELNESTTEEV